MSQPSLVSIAIVLFVIVRFLMRELRERHLSQTQLFLLPGIVWSIALVFAYVVVSTKPGQILEFLLESGIAVAIGVVIGLAVARYTSVRTAADGRVFFRGSYATVAVWVVALLLRLCARFVLFTPQHRTASLAANAALVVLVATALTAVRVLVLRKARSEQARGSALTESAL